jgi:hypothetical protein
MDMDELNSYLEPSERSISEKKVKEEGNGLVAIIVAILLIVITLIILLGLNLQFSTKLFFVLLICAFYLIVLSFLFEPKFIREIFHTDIKTVEKPIEIEKIYTVEKPIHVIRTVEKPVYIDRPRKKLNIPHYDYVGSNQTKIYHKSSCRLGKSIKRKYKVYNNEAKYFIKNKFQPCKVCIQKLKKV